MTALAAMSRIVVLEEEISQIHLEQAALKARLDQLGARLSVVRSELVREHRREAARLQAGRGRSRSRSVSSSSASSGESLCPDLPAASPEIGLRGGAARVESAAAPPESARLHGPAPPTEAPRRQWRRRRPPPPGLCKACWYRENKWQGGPKHARDATCRSKPAGGDEGGRRASRSAPAAPRAV